MNFRRFLLHLDYAKRDLPHVYLKSIISGNSIRLSHLLFHPDMNFVQYTNFCEDYHWKDCPKQIFKTRDIHQKDYHPESWIPRPHLSKLRISEKWPDSLKARSKLSRFCYFSTNSCEICILRKEVTPRLWHWSVLSISHYTWLILHLI